MTKYHTTPNSVQIVRPSDAPGLDIAMPRPGLFQKFKETQQVTEAVSQVRVGAAVEVYKQIVDVAVTRATQQAEQAKADDYINHEGAMNQKRETFIVSTTSALVGVNRAATLGESRLVNQGKHLLHEVESSAAPDQEKAFMQERVIARVRRSLDILERIEGGMIDSIAEGAGQSFSKRSGK